MPAPGVAPAGVAGLGQSSDSVVSSKSLPAAAITSSPVSMVPRRTRPGWGRRALPPGSRTPAWPLDAELARQPAGLLPPEQVVHSDGHRQHGPRRLAPERCPGGWPWPRRRRCAAGSGRRRWDRWARLLLRSGRCWAWPPTPSRSGTILRRCPRRRSRSATRGRQRPPHGGLGDGWSWSSCVQETADCDGEEAPAERCTDRAPHPPCRGA
jgi:hypothetical protein